MDALLKDGFGLIELELRLEVIEVVRVAAAVGTSTGIGKVEVLIDNFSRFSWIYLVSHKDQSLSHLHAWHTMVEKKSRHSLKMIWLNKGGEFTSNEFDHYLDTHGIQR